MKNKQAKQRRKPEGEFPYSFQMQRKVNEPAPLSKRWSIKEKESILDYLHGDVADDEAEACCYYEYARASETLRKARREYNPADPDNSSLRISSHFPSWVIDGRRFCFLQCSNFPRSAWRQLTKKEREDFRRLFKPISPWPIITDARKLNALGVFDRLKQQAQEKAQGYPSPAIVGDNEIRYVVMTIDYRDGPPEVTKQFTRWLSSDANEKLFKNYHKKVIHRQNPDSANWYKERLKFLAASRLYDEFRDALGGKLGFKAASEWTQKNRREDQRPKTERIKLRAFFREKPEQTTEGQRQIFGPQFFGPVYRDRRDWERAKDKANDFLAREIEYCQRAADVG